ncbi:MAG: hypothetical protein KF897_06395 [Opitutaceae bacterium]|nr:hypothetical protein [Opitutaceae bacterium]
MNTAQHVVEATVRAGECLEKNERTWAQLVHEWRGARWLPLVWLAMFACFAVVGGFVFARQAGFNGLIYLAPTAFLAITSPLVVMGPRRRERVLLAAIAREAPELARKLEREGIR